MFRRLIDKIDRWLIEYRLYLYCKDEAPISRCEFLEFYGVLKQVDEQGFADREDISVLWSISPFMFDLEKKMELGIRFAKTYSLADVLDVLVVDLSVSFCQGDKCHG